MDGDVELAVHGVRRNVDRSVGAELHLASVLAVDLGSDAGAGLTELLLLLLFGEPASVVRIDWIGERIRIDVVGLFAEDEGLGEGASVREARLHVDRPRRRGVTRSSEKLAEDTFLRADILRFDFDSDALAELARGGGPAVDPRDPPEMLERRREHDACPVDAALGTRPENADVHELAPRFGTRTKRESCTRRVVLHDERVEIACPFFE